MIFPGFHVRFWHKADIALDAECVMGALVPVILGGGGAPAPVANRPSHPAVSTTPVAKGHRSIALVAFTGDQVPGYQVAEVPSGWVIQGGNPYALVIAPKDDPDTSINAFVGKLVVMLQSRDASAPTSGQSDPVNGHPGFLDVQGDTQILTFQRADGRWVVIQDSRPSSAGTQRSSPNSPQVSKSLLTPSRAAAERVALKRCGERTGSASGPSVPGLQRSPGDRVGEPGLEPHRRPLSLAGQPGEHSRVHQQPDGVDGGVPIDAGAERGPGRQLVDQPGGHDLALAVQLRGDGDVLVQGRSIERGLHEPGRPLRGRR